MCCSHHARSASAGASTERCGRRLLARLCWFLLPPPRLQFPFWGRRLLKRVAGVVLPVPALPLVWLPALSWAVPEPIRFLRFHRHYSRNAQVAAPTTRERRGRHIQLSFFQLRLRTGKVARELAVQQARRVPYSASCIQGCSYHSSLIVMT